MCRRLPAQVKRNEAHERFRERDVYWTSASEVLLQLTPSLFVERPPQCHFSRGGLVAYPERFGVFGVFSGCPDSDRNASSSSALPSGGKGPFRRHRFCGHCFRGIPCAISSCRSCRNSANRVLSCNASSRREEELPKSPFSWPNRQSGWASSTMLGTASAESSVPRESARSLLSREASRSGSSILLGDWPNETTKTIARRLGHLRQAIW